MSFKDTPSIKHMREQMDAFRLILGANKALDILGLGSQKIATLDAQFEDICNKMDELTEYPAKFNQYFAAEGWLAHDTFDFSVLKQIVDEYELNGRPAATKMLLDYYGPDNLDKRKSFLNGVEELRVRKRFIDFALEDYKAKRYHAVVPILLMVMDGAMNEAVGKGFHAQNIDLDVWNSLTTADGAINEIRGIFQRSRKKTCIEKIEFPYRNGILHGMDLGYDNQIVAAKCWCFLFIVRDWIAAKKSESERRKRYDEETRMPNLAELADSIESNQRTKKALAAWSAREITEDYLLELNRNLNADSDTPEHAVIQFIEYWKKGNYGGMAQRFCSLIAKNTKQFAREIRLRFEHLAFTSFAIRNIVDEAPTIAEIFVDLNQSANENIYAKFRMIYEDDNGNSVVRGMHGGTWRVVWVNL